MVTTPKVLIIDDSNTECLFMRQALHGAGYQVLVANNGHQGLQLLAQENPRCLILDIVLPGMSGFEICRNIRSQNTYQNMPIIMVSTKNSTSDRFWAKRQGADYYLPKPFKGDVLIDIVKDVLAEQADAPAASSMPFGDMLQSRTTGAQRPISTPPPPRSTGAPRPVSTPPPEQRPVGINAKSVNEAKNPYHESGMPFSSGTTSGQRPMNVRAASDRADPQTSPASRPVNSGTGPQAPIGVGGSTSAFHFDEPQPTGHQVLGATFGKLIPHRNENAGLGWSNRLDNLFITDSQARELYIAIDGQRNMEVLGLMTLMGREEMARAVRILLSLQRILLYDPNGRLIDNLFN